MIFVVLLVAAGMLIPDLYIWDTFVREGRTVWSVIYWVPSLLFVALAVSALIWKRFNAGWMNILTALLLGVALPKAMFALVAWIGSRSTAVWPYAEPLGYYGGLVIAVIVMALSGFGLFVGWRMVTIQRVEMSFPTLPEAFDGYKIVQLTDFHIGTYSTVPETVARIVETVNALKADMVVFTGDLINLRPTELDAFAPVLARLHGNDGVLSVLGNHDYCHYVKYPTPRGAAEACSRLMDAERAMGWRLLLNESVTVRRGGSEIAFVGVENDGRPPFPSRGDLHEAMKGLPQGIFKVLLSHDPTHWRREVLPSTDIELTLSGHTHAMQFKVGRFSPSRFAYQEWGGEYRVGDRALYVSTGIGSNLRFRFGAWPEVVEITLRRSL